MVEPVVMFAALPEVDNSVRDENVNGPNSPDSDASLASHTKVD
jgi:hypothetical protein